MTYDRELRTEAAHALTHNQEVWSDRGYAVVTAGGLSEGDTDFELDVGPYDVLVGSTTQTSVGPTTLSVNAPDSDPYWLVVYVDGEGLQTEQGPEGEVFVGDQSVVASNADVREITSPAPPTLADIGPVTILGKVLVTSSGVTNSLIDDRVFQSERVFDVVNARSASVESADSERYNRNGNRLLGYERIDRETPSSGEFNKDYSLTGDREYLLTYSARIERFEVWVRFDNDDGNNYIWYDAESIKQEDEDKILLWETRDNDFVRVSGNVLINKGHFDDEGRWGIDHRLTGYSAERIADFGRDGTHTGLAADTDMTLHFDGIQDNGEAVIELWERDYS